MSYFDFLANMDKSHIQTVFELGSRDLHDAVKLSAYFETANVYAFECNADCLVECRKTLERLDDASTQSRVHLVDKAVSLENGEVTFYPFDLQQYNNMGASSMLKIDFSKRTRDDPDYGRPNPQKETTVDGTRLDTFLESNSIGNIDLLCIDLQGYELNALKSLGRHLERVKYIITECSIENTYTGGATFTELADYLAEFGFQYHSSNRFGRKYPDMTLRGFSEFDALFVKNST